MNIIKVFKRQSTRLASLPPQSAARHSLPYALLGVSLALALLIAPGLSFAGVKVYLDDTRTKYVWAKKMDCSIHKSRKGITIGFKVGNMLIGTGPEVTFGGEQARKWDKTAQNIIARYEELCSRFNTGAMTMKEYNDRLNEIDEIANKTMELQEKMKERIKKDANDTFDELDRAVAMREGGEDPATLDQDLNSINRKIKGLKPLDQPASALTGEPLSLINDEDVRRQKEAGAGPSIDAAREVAEVTNGPIIRVLSPPYRDVSLPVQIEIVFEQSERGEAVDMDSLKIVYEGFLRIDLTDRIRPFVTENKIFAPKVKLPRGEYKISIYIEDRQRNASIKPLLLNVGQ